LYLSNETTEFYVKYKNFEKNYIKFEFFGQKTLCLGQKTLCLGQKVWKSLVKVQKFRKQVFPNSEILEIPNFQKNDVELEI